MGAENSYLKNHVSLLCRKNAIEQAIYVSIETTRRHLPSVSVDEAVKSFMVHFNITEDDMSFESIRGSYFRTQKQLYEEQRKHTGKSPFYFR